MNPSFDVGNLHPALAGPLTNTALAWRKDVEVEERSTKLTSIKDWLNWWELWDAYMQQTYDGTADIPFSYVYHEHQAVTIVMCIAAYQDEDNRCTAIMALQGRHYQP
jgi:hypothetical protein